MAVVDPLKLTITNWPEGEVVMVDVPNNPEDPDAGTTVPFSGSLWIERADFELDPPPKYYRLTPGVKFGSGPRSSSRPPTPSPTPTARSSKCWPPMTPRQGGAAPDGRKVKSTMHWVSAPTAVDAVARTTSGFSDRIRVPDERTTCCDTEPGARVERRAKLEPVLAETEPGQVVQFERLGYYAADLDDPRCSTGPSASETSGPTSRSAARRDVWCQTPNVTSRR